MGKGGRAEGKFLATTPVTKNHRRNREYVVYVEIYLPRRMIFRSERKRFIRNNCIMRVFQPSVEGEGGQGGSRNRAKFSSLVVQLVERRKD